MTDSLLPNTKIDATGIIIDNLTTISNTLITNEQAIYGSDTNYNSNSPDANRVNIYALNVEDILEKIVDVYNSFDPDKAIGINLDARVAINNIQRQGATYTFVPIDITVDRALNLTGLDTNLYSSSGTGYTIKDSSGNQFILAASQTFSTAGTYHCSFRAANIGNILTTLNTITIPVDVVLGVISVNNSLSATQIGQNEETDTNLRYRRQISTCVNSLGFLPTLQSQLLNLANVTDAKVFDNPTNVVVNGIPAHGIWCIVLGGTQSDIVECIYKNRYGGDMKGSQSISYMQVNGTTMLIKYDVPIDENLYIKITIADLEGSTIDTATLKTKIVENIAYKISEVANATDIVYYVKSLLPNSYISYCEVSADNLTYSVTLAPTDNQHIFVLDRSRILIND